MKLNCQERQLWKAWKQVERWIKWKRKSVERQLWDDYSRLSKYVNTEELFK